MLMPETRHTIMSESDLPKVSVVCPIYNRTDHIGDTVESLLAQTYPNFDIVLVNDGSPDPRVRDILNSYDDPRLRVIHQHNTGFTHAIRRAVAESDGRFIAVMGAGDICAPHRLALQADFLASNPDYAIIGCEFRSAKIPSTNPDTPFHNWDMAPGAELPAHGTLSSSPGAADLKRRNAFSHGEVMIRRTHYDAVDGYRVFFANTQDLDLWLRLTERYRLGVLADFLYERRIFLADGIAPDLKKSLVQIAYSGLAKQCHSERARGRRDSVEIYGAATMMRVPMGLATTKRILRAVKQVKAIGDLHLSQLNSVRDLYGLINYMLAFAYAGYLLMRYKNRIPPKRGR